MKNLVRFLLIFICMKLIVSKPQHLQEHTQYHLDPLNEPQFEYPPKDPEKRTLGSRHYALGKHVGIHPSGFKYVLGYSPINIKYVPVTKPVTILKPVLQHSIKPLWNPVVTPSKVYLPIHKPIHHHVEHGWKPIVPVKPPATPVHEVQHIHSVVEQPVPVQQVQHLVPAISPVPAPVVPAPAIVPALPAAIPIKPPIHNYFYFQTPIAKPALLPQPALLHVARPQLPVLPLGASFPAPILQSPGAGFLHFPSAPIAPIPFPHQPAPVLPVHQPVAPVHHPVPVHPVPAPAPPVHHPVVIHPQPAPPAVHLHPQPAFPPPPHAALPPISVEFHGKPHFVPFNNQIPFTAVQSPAPLPLPVLPVHKTPHTGRQPHALPLPPEVHTHLIPEVQFNPEAAIQPGQTDLQLPMHLPDHPHFRHLQQPAVNYLPQLPPFQNHGNILRPSITLEPPITHGHKR